LLVPPWQEEEEEEEEEEERVAAIWKLRDSQNQGAKASQERDERRERK